MKIAQIKKPPIIIGIFLFCILALSSYSLWKPAFGKEKEKNVLLINSYNQTYQSTADKILGIKNIFEANNVNFDVEYMDTKKYDTQEYQKLFYELIKYKLRHFTTYDAILVSDDNALQFAMDHREDLFKNLPIVFMAVNDLERAEDAVKNYNITGVAENLSVSDNIELGLKINPTATQVVAVVDQTLTGIGDMKQFMREKEKYPKLNFRTIDTSSFNQEELVKVLQKIRDDSIVIYFDMNRDGTGRNYSITEATDIIRENVPVPVLRIEAGGIGSGIAGGKTVNYVRIGEVAADMVVRILNGTQPETIPVDYSSYTDYKFDYNVLKHFNIKKQIIPKDAIIINRPDTMYGQYRDEVLRFLAVIALLAVLLIIVAWDNRKHRKMIRRLQEKDEYIEHQAKYDELTDLPNINLFFEKLGNEIVKGHSGAVILLDIDNFKGVNDTLGHEYGNKLLIQIACRLSDIDPKKLTISRYGGDEFLIMVSDEDNRGIIEEYIQKIKTIFKEALVVESRENFINASIGITCYPKDGTDPAQLLINADTSMYRVKHSGKNNHIFYNNGMLDEIKNRIEIESILRQALKTEGFELVYQPQVNTFTGEITGFEGLLRLKDVRVSPGIFIPIAEEAGLIIEIGRWVIKEAISQIAKWKEKGYPIKPIAVNFSNKQLQDEELCGIIREYLYLYKVEPEYLEIEITESILLEKTERTSSFLADLKALGINLALDDFGSGFSSINYLTFIPVYKIKLDKTLCDRFLEKENEEVIVNLISLVHSLGLVITAEGIEKMEQYVSLKNSGCDYIQGYLFSRPIKVEEVEEIYKKKNLKLINI